MRYVQYFFRSKLFCGIRSFLKKLVLPGFDGLPVYDVLRFFLKGIAKGYITTRASAISFNLFIAIFPAVIVFFTIIPYVPLENFQTNLFIIMQDLLPAHTFGAVEGTLFDIINRPRGGLLSIGFVLAVYFALSGINSIIDSFNQTWHNMASRPLVKQYLISLALVFILSFIVIIAVTALTIVPLVLRFLLDAGIFADKITVWIIQICRWIVVLAMFLLGYSFLYYLAPESRQPFRFISAGSTLATVLTVVTSVGFNFYVNNFSRYNTLYGSIGTLLVIMLWIYFNAIVLLIGFELNASIYNVRRTMD